MNNAVMEWSQSARLWRVWSRLGIQDIRLRFRRSTIGVWWIFLSLAVMILSVGFVYGNLLGQDLRQFIPFLTVGLILWGYLSNSIVEGGNAFIGSEGYIKQISLPIYVYVLRYFVSVSLNTLISFAAFGIVAVVYGVRFDGGTLWAFPGLLTVMTTSLLLVTIFAYLNARFRDATHLAAVAMQVMFYVTPVLYPAELLRARGIGFVVDLNPLYHVLEIVRHPLLFAAPADVNDYLMTGLIIAILVVAALVVAGRYRRRIVYYL